jgi:ribonuclease VapC
VNTFAIDTSALAAILFNEPERELFLSKILSAKSILVSSASVLETRMVVQSRKGQAGVLVLGDMLKLPLFNCIAPTLSDMDAAYEAFIRYGKGSGHPAQLNYGDLFSYALAKTRSLPLLYKGNDFAQTDLAAA